MPLPLILGIGAAIAGVAGLGSGIAGGVKMKDANDTMKMAQNKQEAAKKKFEDTNKKTTLKMDELGTLEMNILASFGRFSNAFEKIKNRPDFKDLNMEKYNIPKFDAEELKKVSVGAGVLAGGLGGAALGTAGGFAAAGATTAAVMALGTASTGTAIASLSGVAATNATLAALGGGAIAAGGGGMALGTAVLGGATLGVGLLVGGLIFNVTGSKISDKADEAYSQACKTEETVNKICVYLDDLYFYADRYLKSLKNVNNVYSSKLERLEELVKTTTDWRQFTDDQKVMTQNLVLLVGLLNKMCKVKLVLKGSNENDINKVNKSEVDTNVRDANDVISKVA